MLPGLIVGPGLQELGRRWGTGEGDEIGMPVTLLTISALCQRGDPFPAIAARHHSHFPQCVCRDRGWGLGGKEPPITTWGRGSAKRLFPLRPWHTSWTVLSHFAEEKGSRDDFFTMLWGPSTSLFHGPETGIDTSALRAAAHGAPPSPSKPNHAQIQTDPDGSTATAVDGGSVAVGTCRASSGGQGLLLFGTF